MGGSLTAADFQAYNPDDASTVEAGPLALYTVAVDSIMPTQMNEGFAEVDAKAAAYDLFTTIVRKLNPISSAIPSRSSSGPVASSICSTAITPSPP